MHDPGLQKFPGRLIRTATAGSIVKFETGVTHLAIGERDNLNQQQWLKVRDLLAIFTGLILL